MNLDSAMLARTREVKKVPMQLSQQRILLVDDEEGIRFTLGTLLKKEGYHVDTAAVLCLKSNHIRNL